MGVEVTFYDDPAVFAELAEPLLAADPLSTTVIGTVARITADSRSRGEVSERSEWWALVREDGVLASAAMLAEGGRAVGMFAGPMSDRAAHAIAGALLDRGEIPVGVNGALPAARLIADRLAAATGRAVGVLQRSRLHLLGELIEPAGIPGRARLARIEDVEVVRPWLEVFEAEAAIQAGRDDPGPETVPATSVVRLVEQERLWVWEHEGQVVHATGHNPPVHGVARIAPVYTPPDFRGKGFAKGCVAAVSRHLTDRGLQVCLYTDLDNQTSNHVYATLGFMPFVDQADHVFL
ncbi:MAG: GNAT family N-acetyltransferase [Acidimicrobiia bacterium]|nr:GNAT family N-acetyltransferase [Acidimicrobiia bacterium]MDH4305893.1 GNAT family N-acetyltransferase [Acidimicrobiia bacterium]MDH5292637.1 GNAT family N-acetyltransferase [Acidimicrobiia bacterium]